MTSNSSAVIFEDLPPWEDDVDGGALLREISDHASRLLYLDPFVAETLALWTLHTYVFQHREISTYLAVQSAERRCGKTTALSFLQDVGHRMVSCSNISPPALFRLIGEHAPTLLIDEADTLLPGNDELRGILNSGYRKKTAFVIRVSSDPLPVRSAFRKRANPKSRLARYSVWCPE